MQRASRQDGPCPGVTTETSLCSRQNPGPATARFSEKSCALTERKTTNRNSSSGRQTKGQTWRWKELQVRKMINIDRHFPSCLVSPPTNGRDSSQPSGSFIFRGRRRAGVNGHCGLMTQRHLFYHLYLIFTFGSTFSIGTTNRSFSAVISHSVILGHPR